MPATTHAPAIAALVRAARALLLAALLLAPAPARAAGEPSDPAAVKIADRVIRSLGGREHFDALPGLRWTFRVMNGDTVRSSRRHAWNKHTGQHRVEGTLRDGTPYVFVHTLGDTLHGIALLGGRSIAGDSLHSLLRRGEVLWVNDSYWFLMPWKLRDNGVHLALAGEIRDSSGTYDRIAMSFGRVGLTPGDRYWVDVNRANHRVERWEYVLEGRQPPPVRWTWEGWQEHGGLWFPTAHRQDGAAILTTDVEAVKEFPAGTFEPR